MSESIMSNVFQQINYMEEVGYQMLAANFEDVIEENPTCSDCGQELNI